MSAASRPLWRRNPVRGRFIAAGDSPASILCLPNVISIARIVLIPVFLWMLFAGGQDGALRWAAAAVFIVAIATDAIDGHIARRRGLVTDLGIFLDPVADKGITGAALIGLAILGELPWWAVGLILLREVGITVFRAVALRDRVIPASRGGKLKTVVQAVAISYWLLPLASLVSWDPSAGLTGAQLLAFSLGGLHWVLLVAVLAITLWTGIDYLVAAARSRRSVASDAPPGQDRRE